MGDFGFGLLSNAEIVVLRLQGLLEMDNAFCIVRWT
jgi:hypothetical protein